MPLTSESVRRAADRVHRGMQRSAAELNELDGRLGDGDLGATLVRAGEALAAQKNELPDDVGLALTKCAQIFLKSSAGTFGILAATGLLAAGKMTTGRREVPLSEMPAMLEAALKAMASRGNSRLGDKTILDAIEAARRACELASGDGALLIAVDASVGEAIVEFRPKTFQQGRARIFGEKGVGCDDPGMVAFKRLVEALLADG